MDDVCSSWRAPAARQCPRMPWERGSTGGRQEVSVRAIATRLTVRVRMGTKCGKNRTHGLSRVAPWIFFFFFFVHTKNFERVPSQTLTQLACRSKTQHPVRVARLTLELPSKSRYPKQKEKKYQYMLPQPQSSSSSKHPFTAATATPRATRRTRTCPSC